MLSIVTHSSKGIIWSVILDQRYVRSWLYRNNYMFFVKDDSILPRELSLSEKPMTNAIPFKSPEAARVVVNLPSGKSITGMAASNGILLITGGGYHGKTTLLEAIQEGIYNHISGDGREFVISKKYTVLVKAEDGRIVSHVDISSFIDELPIDGNTSDYTSLDSSGSTSMAASINEAIESGAEVLLIDEDTSATNLLYKDHVMNRVVYDDPLKPLCLQVRSLVAKTGISVIIVAGASSSFISVADKVIIMRRFIPSDITKEVRNMIEHRDFSSNLPYNPPRKRMFQGIKGLRRIKANGYKIVAEFDGGENSK